MNDILKEKIDFYFGIKPRISFYVTNKCSLNNFILTLRPPYICIHTQTYVKPE